MIVDLFSAEFLTAVLIFSVYLQMKKRHSLLSQLTRSKVINAFKLWNSWTDLLWKN